MSRLPRRWRGLFRRMVLPFLLFSLVLALVGLAVGSKSVLLCAAATVGFSTVFCFRLSNQIRSSLRRLHQGIDELAAGRLVPPMRDAPFDEVTGVGNALNEFSRVLAANMRSVRERQDREETIFSSMREGLIAVDHAERVIKANQAAAPLMRIPLELVEGRPAQEVFRYAALHRFLRRVLNSQEPLGEEVELHDERERILQAQGAPLRDAEGAARGAVVVLHEITQLRRLERVRREFVANVSHELKTPATSIRGFVETLRDGAVDDPDQARRFLDILVRQTDRLQSIIEDLLMLSRLEEQADRQDMPRQATPLRPVLETAVQFCALQADGADLPVVIECADDLEAYINPPLVEQAVMNLVDNAVKYGGEDNQILVRARQDNGSVVVSVRDRGPGISREHLPRVFERFYRVDKARSRARGGTGLGLAIVKHIAQAHGGAADVRSRPGEGAEFRLRFPQT